MSDAIPPTGPSSSPLAAPPSIVRDEAETQRLIRRRDVRRRTGVALAVAAVGVVAVLVATGILPWLPGSSAEDAIPFSRAVELANRTAPAFLGAHPQFLLVAGIDSRNASTLAPSTLTRNATANCTLTPLAGYPISGSLYVPPYAGSFAAGLAPLWIVVLQSSSNGPFAIVVVVASAALPIAELSGPRCSASSSGLLPLPSGVADSPGVAQVAWNSTGSAYVAATPSATTLTLTAFGGTSGLPPLSPLWLFVYGPCSPLASGNVSSTARVAALGLTSGSFVGSLNQAIGCPA